jgi:CBS domain-containing protein
MMRARDVMTSAVVSVTPETTVQQLALLLVHHQISAVPVVDEENHVVGMVSEGDLLHRDEIETEKKTDRRSWWLHMLGSDRGAADYIKSHARTVGEVMTRKPVCVTEETSLGEIASILESHRIKRVPVLRDGRLAGIVSRSNLVQALATAAFSETAKAAPANRRRNSRDAPGRAGRTRLGFSWAKHPREGWGGSPVGLNMVQRFARRHADCRRTDSGRETRGGSHGPLSDHAGTLSGRRRIVG